jgi:hypothetical protein
LYAGVPSLQGTDSVVWFMNLMTSPPVVLGASASDSAHFGQKTPAGVKSFGILNCSLVNVCWIVQIGPSLDC